MTAEHDHEPVEIEAREGGVHALRDAQARARDEVLGGSGDGAGGPAPSLPGSDGSDETLSSWLHRPFVDLTPVAPEGNVWTLGLVLALRALEDGRDGARLNGVRAEEHRTELLAQARLPRFDVDGPRDLPRHLWSPQWDLVVRSLYTSPADPEQQLRAMWVLVKAQMHRAVLSMRPPGYPDVFEKKPAFFDALVMRGMSRSASMIGRGAQPELEAVASEAEWGSWAAVEATYLLAAGEAKQPAPDLELLRRWTSDHDHQVDRSLSCGPHKLALRQSRAARVRAFVPHLEGDAVATAAAMDEAEDWLRGLPPATPDERAEALVVKTALAESNTKAALAAGDGTAAEKWAYRYCHLGPLDPQAHLTLGDVRWRDGLLELALSSYRRAALLGPPGTERALFAVGRCCEELGRLDEARDAYLAALTADPLGAGSLKRLVEIADPLLATWARGRLETLATIGEPEGQRAHQKAYA